MRRSPSPLSLLIWSSLLALGCGGGGGGEDDEVGESGSTEAEGGESDTGAEADYQATIRRTSHGVAHIYAEDWGSLGFGQGYAFTEDKGCILADQIVKVRSQRSRYFGQGDNSANLYSDLAFLHLDVRGFAEANFSRLQPWVQEVTRGYAAGYNAAVAAGTIGGECDGADWVPMQIDEYDLFSYHYNLALLASSWQFIAAIGSATPPGGAPPSPPPEHAPHFSTINGHRGVLGSNGWGVGSELSAGGKGMLFANPHFPWHGEFQLWESHLVGPEGFEVYGVGLLGVPGVLIGFNEGMAWTHTVSDGHRLTLYEMDCPPGEPTKYYYDGELLDMESQTYEVEVLQGDGTLAPVSRTLWRTIHGPMINVEPFYWTEALALSYRDANIENFRLIEQFMGMNDAKTLEDFQQVHAEVNGVPWVNTVATSADGRAWYTDSAATPNLSDEAIAAWYERRDMGGFTKAFADEDVWLLEGNTSRDTWVDDPSAARAGLVPAADQPRLERTDFVFNANDSHWLSNPKSPLEGYSPLHGFEATPRQLRTRLNAQMLLDIDAGGGFAGADGKLDLDELETAALANQGMAEILLREELVMRCTGVGPWEVDGESVDLGEACALLEAWDGLLDLDSVGAVIWREWISDYGYLNTYTLSDNGALYAELFDPADPVGTPSGLAPASGPDDDRALDALARAVLRLQEAGVALDAPLGSVQFARRFGQDIPMHGGIRNEGMTNMIVNEELRSDLGEIPQQSALIHEESGLTDEGYLVNYGSSFMMVLEYTDEGPEARAILSYSQSAEAGSGWTTDQTEMFSNKQWRPALWHEADILADPNLSEYGVEGNAQQ